MSGLGEMWVLVLQDHALAVMGLPPDTRTTEERLEEQRKWAALQPERDAAARAARAEVELTHHNLLATATGLRHAVIELHAPEFYYEIDATGHCSGCEYEANWEGTATDFPCQTYTLAAGWVDG